MMPLQGVSLVTAPYTANGQVLGVLGVIGPKRMAYDRVIPLVGPRPMCSARPFHRPRARREHPTLETQHPAHTRVVGGGV